MFTLGKKGLGELFSFKYSYWDRVHSVVVFEKRVEVVERVSHMDA